MMAWSLILPSAGRDSFCGISPPGRVFRTFGSIHRYNHARGSNLKIASGLPAPCAVIPVGRAELSEALGVRLKNFAVAIAHLTMIDHLLYGADRIVEFMTIEAA